MYGTSPSRPLPTPYQPATSFSTLQDYISPSSASDYALSATGAALDALKDILEAVDTLPCVKYIAGVGVKILETLDEVQSTEKAVHSVGIRARDIALAVARACAGAHEGMELQLEKDLNQLSETMTEILSFTQELALRSKYKKLLYKSQDAEAAQSLDTQLTHAFRIFEEGYTIQSSVSLRISQQQVVQQLSSISLTSPTIANKLLYVPEGLYMIRSAHEGRIIESEHNKAPPTLLHAYAAPPSERISAYQLWVIFKKQGVDFKYHIRNFATGVALDVFSDADSHNHVICWASHGNSNQTWEFYGSKSAQSTDFCTIHSLGPRTVLDAKCPTPGGSDCDYLHQTHLSRQLGPTVGQEWTLIRFPFSSLPPRPSPSLASPPANDAYEMLVRRPYKLQNVLSGHFMSAINLEDDDDDEQPNIIVRDSFASGTNWHFVHTAEDREWCHHDDMFAIAAGEYSRLATIDHWGGQHIAAYYGRFWPANEFHQWKVVPRDGAFVFRNLGSGQLLAQSKTEVVAIPAKSLDDPACQWRLVDAKTGNLCRVLYDSTLSIMPPELGGPLTMPDPGFSVSSIPGAEPVIRTELAPPDLHRQFFDGLKHGHELVREMLKSGYASLVVAPQLVRGWKNGRVHDIVVREEETVLRLWKLKGKDGFDRCD